MLALFDVNVLVHAVNAASQQHAVAQPALAASMRAGEAALTWHSLLGFLRLTTRSGILAKPLQIEQALTILQSWLAYPGVSVLAPGERHADLLSRLLLGAGIGGNLAPDAHLAAIAIEHQAQMVTFDRDFERFAGLRVKLLGK